MRPNADTQYCDPNGTIKWKVSGSTGATVTLTLQRVQNTGGHVHSGGPTGSVSPSSFTLTGPYPQNVPVTYSAPNAAGLIKLISTFSIGADTLDYNNVGIQGLERLTETTGIQLTGAKS